MKRRLIAALVAALVVSGGGLGAGTAHAATYFEGGITKKGEAELWYEGSDANVVVPAKWKGKPVVSVGLYLRAGVKSVDLTKATGLRELHLSGNRSKLAAVDLSKNTKLTSINVDDVPLKSLSLATNKSLKTLELANTKLAKLDLAKNTKLVSLYSNADPVKAVTLPKTKTLKSVGFYAAKKLTGLNVKNNTALTTLTLAESGLAKIDLSKNKALKVLDLGATKIKPAAAKVPALSKLTELHLEGNIAFTTLDLMKLTKLKTLNLRDTRLKSVDVTKNKLLTGLYVAGSFKKLDLSSNPKLKYLGISSSKLATLSLTKNKELRELELSKTLIKTLDLAGLSKLQIVQVTGNKNLASVKLGGNSGLHDLWLPKNALTSLDVSSLNGLRYLTINGNPGLAVAIDPLKNPRLDEVCYSPTRVSKSRCLILSDEEEWTARTLTNATS